MSALIAVVCIIIFAVGMWCYGLAFQIHTSEHQDLLRMLVFFAGILLNSLALWIPFQVIGHSQKKKLGSGK
ncbi:hypothetical protein F8O01_04405 [Pseudoclavibacter chungangensis]|uniref:Uncharacterized protein n=1 Tax=Pseudoclavibacter chungangensis TaxID=587635 RepID=A0A7J5BZT7_9MICO|nr:hypothetical protein [Pseudoclavibacter chungangensis]KAB1660169.1 hypothetical protein F8O01_04405 [Pseudoclavibacter chungangensis]NYJ66718.1 tryptophan-rich sensory protein [Pseudoclavibacter chungangensis]